MNLENQVNSLSGESQVPRRGTGGEGETVNQADLEGNFKAKVKGLYT